MSGPFLLKEVMDITEVKDGDELWIATESAFGFPPMVPEKLVVFIDKTTTPASIDVPKLRIIVSPQEVFNNEYEAFLQYHDLLAAHQASLEKSLAEAVAAKEQASKHIVELRGV